MRGDEGAAHGAFIVEPTTEMMRLRQACGDRRDRSQGDREIFKRLILFGYVLALAVNKEFAMKHLDSIAIRQRSSRVRDAIFAGFVALGVLLSVTSVSTAVQAASTHSIPASVASR